MIETITLQNWLSLYSNGKRPDYGLEFLTEVTFNGLNTNIPNSERYRLPETLTPRNLRSRLQGKPTYIAQRLHFWKKGAFPMSIKSIDQLRENTSSPWYLDLLEYPQGIPDDHPIISSLAYLSASILCGGYLSGNSGAIVLPGRNQEAVIEKIKDITVPVKKQFQLRAPYVKILHLLNVRSGRLVHANYNELGLCYLEPYMERSDENSKKIFKRFFEAVYDHKKTEKSSSLMFPYFRYSETAERLGAFIKKATIATGLDQYYDVAVRSHSRQNKHYFFAEMITQQCKQLRERKSIQYFQSIFEEKIR